MEKPLSNAEKRKIKKEEKEKALLNAMIQNNANIENRADIKMSNKEIKKKKEIEAEAIINPIILNEKINLLLEEAKFQEKLYDIFLYDKWEKADDLWNEISTKSKLNEEKINKFYSEIKQGHKDFNDDKELERENKKRLDELDKEYKKYSIFNMGVFLYTFFWLSSLYIIFLIFDYFTNFSHKVEILNTTELFFSFGYILITSFWIYTDINDGDVDSDTNIGETPFFMGLFLMGLYSALQVFNWIINIYKYW